MKQYLILIFSLLSVCLWSQNDKAGFDLNDIKQNPQDVESICYSNGTDTLSGWKIHTTDIIDGYGYVIVDIDGNEVVGGFEVDGKYCSNLGCELEKLYSIVGTNGVIEQQWTGASAIDQPAYICPSEGSFSGRDAEGLPLHPNAPTATITKTQFTATNVIGVDQWQLDSWIYVPETVQIRDINANAESGEVWIGTCGSKPILKGCWKTTPWRLNEIGTLQKGFHRIRVYIDDPSPDASGFRLDWNLGGTYAPIPAQYLFTEKPEVLCRPVYICNGDKISELDSTIINLTDFDSWCDPVLCGDGSSSGGISEVCLRVREDILAVDNAGTQFGNLVQSITRVVGVSDGQNFDLTFPIGTYTYQGTNGNNQTLSIANALNLLLDNNNINHSLIYNGVATVNNTYLAWTPLMKACPSFTFTQVQVTLSNGTTVRNLPIYRENGDLRTVYRRACDGCYGGYSWVDVFGNAIDSPEPACLIACGDTYPAVEEPVPPTCVTSEPIISCFDDNGTILTAYILRTFCDGILEQTDIYDANSVAANPSDPDSWTILTIPATATPVTCVGAEIIDIQVLCDDDGVQHEVRTYSLAGVTYKETFVPSTNTPSVPSGSLSECPPVGSVSEINVCADNETAIKKTIVNADGTENVLFIRTNGLAFTPTTWLAGDCPCKDRVLIGNLKKPILNPGVNVSYWGTNAATHGDPVTVFQGGFDTHVNGAADGTGVINSWSISDITVAGAVGATNVSTDQFIAWSYIYLTEDTWFRDINGNTGERMAFWVDDVKIYESPSGDDSPWPGSSTGLFGDGDPLRPEYLITKGVHKVGFQVNDFSASGGVQLQSSTDLSTWINFPMAQTSIEPITFECFPVLKCIDTGEFTNAETDLTTTIEPLDKWVDTCECCESGSGSSSIEETQYTTTFDSQFFTSAFSVPTAPANTKEVVVFNNSNAWLEFDTNYGTQIVPPNGTAEWSVNPYESGITFNSVSIVSGTFGGSSNWVINYKTQI